MVPNHGVRSADVGRPSNPAIAPHPQLATISRLKLPSRVIPLEQRSRTPHHGIADRVPLHSTYCLPDLVSDLVPAPTSSIALVASTPRGRRTEP